ncbi:hypothetical protein DRQ36_08145 [bacterium]|nr:MAG: hypothetical protein DRQ36_08145 [bacterium]
MNSQGDENSLIKTNLNIKLVAEAAIMMRTPVGASLVGAREREGTRPSPTEGITETIFRGPTAQIQLTREEYREEKKHGWLEIE